jgi:sugar-specific transcriptional regulator TrmB
MTNQSNLANNTLIKQLRDVGLKQNESEIYLWLLLNGLSTPPQIAKGTSIARTNCYNILQSLLEKDVVDEQLKGKKKVYTARNPQSLKLNLERKIESVERILPDLEAIHTTQKNKPAFRFYDGFTEVKEIYNLSITSNTKIYGLGSTERLQSLDPKFFENLLRTLHKKGVEFQDILTADSVASSKLIDQIQGKNHTMKLLPIEYSENITDMLIWNDNIALISLEEPIFGTVIKSKPLANTLKTIFELIWNNLN